MKTLLLCFVSNSVRHIIESRPYSRMAVADFAAFAAILRDESPGDTFKIYLATL